MKKLNKMPFLLFLIFGMVNVATSQTVLKVVTKSIEKKMDYKSNYSLHITGEKAAITIDTWEQNEIKVNIDLSAKHPDVKVAEKDLEYFKYVSERIGKKIYLRNYIAIPSGKDKPTSKYKANFKIMVPETCEVYLNNTFGKTQINDLKGKLNVQSKFCKIDLKNLDGNVFIHSDFGDINGVQLAGDVNIESKRSDITLSRLEGKYRIQSRYGVIRINADEDLMNLSIDAEKTDIHFYNRQLGRYQYALISDHGEIKIPETMQLDFDQITEHTKKASSKKVKESTVNIQTSFGDIIIEEKK